MLITLGTTVFNITNAYGEANYNLEEGIAIPHEVLSEEDKSLKLLVPGASLEISCSKVKTSESTISAEWKSSAKLEASECATYQLSPLLLVAGCNPLEPITAKVKSLLIKHEGEVYNLLSPDGETLTFTNVGFHCGALPLTVPITGHAVVEDPAGFQNESIKHLTREASQALFKADVLKFGANNASLDGSLWLMLGGAYTGRGWSAME